MTQVAIASVSGTTLALVSVIATAAVAIAVPFINAQLEEKRMTLRRREARLDEVRQLLDGALQHLVSADSILVDIQRESLKEPSASEWSPTRLRQLGEQLTVVTEQCAEDGNRLGVRIPAGSQVANALGEATMILRRYEADYHAYLGQEPIDQEKPPPPPEEDLWTSVRAFREEIRKFAGVVAPVPVVEGSHVKRLASRFAKRPN